MKRGSEWTLEFRTIAVVAFLATGAAAAADTPGLAPRIDVLFADWNRSDAPGAAVAVVQNGRIVYENAFGMADLERGVALTPRSVFEIGSISKQFTAMCILLLELDGVLSLDDDVRKHLPEMPAYERPITLRHLLHHTSGIRDVETLIPLAGMPYVNYYTDARLLELITRQKGLNFPPGDEYLYSNSGYLLLAQIVERVSGRSLRELAQERIFGPLGMRHTTFWDDPGQLVKDRALAYSAENRMEMWNLPFDGPAGLYTTVGDLALWDANFYDNKLGGGAALIDRMTTPGKLGNGEPIDYALGLVVSTYRDRPLISHGGAWMGYRAGLMRFPEDRLTVILLSNAASIDVSARSIADLFLGEAGGSDGDAPAPFEPPGAIELPPELLAEYEGTYWNESDRLLRKIEVRDEKLYYVRGAGSATELGALEDGRFVMIGAGIRVDVEFESEKMTVAVEGEDTLVFEPVANLSEESLAAYVGDYWSEELERELGLRLENGRIQVAWAGDHEPVPAENVETDRFVAPRFVDVPWSPQDVELEIDRGPSGEVAGLRLSCEMVRGIKFVKRPR